MAKSNNKFKIVQTKNFVKSYKKLSAKDKDLTDELLDLLREGNVLPAKYFDHQLKGNLQNLRECHIRGDLLFVYEKDGNVLVITAINVGTHNQVFK